MSGFSLRERGLALAPPSARRTLGREGRGARAGRPPRLRRPEPERMEYSHYAILLLMLSLALLTAEVFVPSGGFISVLMLLSLAGSVFCAFRAWWGSSPTLWWSYV